jgi:hypothetical protein
MENLYKTYTQCRFRIIEKQKSTLFKVLKRILLPQYEYKYIGLSTAILGGKCLNKVKVVFFQA